MHDFYDTINLKVMINKSDKKELLNFLRQELPRLLRDDPDFRTQVIGVLAETLGTKAEFNALLQELREMRIESDKRFQEMREDFNKRFEQVDKRFEQVDKRFEQMDKRFQEMREDFNKRFEQVDKRFEQVDKRFEQVDKRFEQMDKRFQEMREDFLTTRQDFENRFRHITLRLNELTIGMGSLGGRTGKALEDVIRQVIEEYSGIEKLKAERLILEDIEGEVFGIKGATVEFDAYVTDGKRFLVEIKGYTDENDVLNFHRKSVFAEKKLGWKFDKVVITPAIDKRALKRCEELGIEVHAFSITD
jgi:hypothetical protein